jgi:hypothetical protein
MVVLRVTILLLLIVIALVIRIGQYIYEVLTNEVDQ